MRVRFPSAPPITKALTETVGAFCVPTERFSPTLTARTQLSDRKAPSNEYDVTAPPPPGTDVHPPALPGSGHELPARFSNGPLAPATQRRRMPRGLLIGLGSGAAVVAALCVTQLFANLGYDSAASQYTASAHAADEAHSAARAATAYLQSTTDAGTRILTGENRPITVAADVEAALAAATEEGTAAITEADEILAVGIPAVGTKPGWFWELFGATAELDQRRDDVDDLAEELSAASADVTSAREAITESGARVITAAGDAAPAFEAAHLSARNEAVVALRAAAAEAIAATTVDDGSAAVYVALQEAAAQVVATESEEMAEKAGPLRSARLEIEAFARSLAPGVLLDFDWAPVVNGAGYDGSMGGYTTWWWDDPGRATIELSNSVAEQWPAERSKALVAHEVGHAISVKCQDMYDSSTQDSIEKWATAWAISMGYTDDANGVWAYGYPPQNYIDAAAGCR